MSNQIATAQWIDPASIAGEFPYVKGKFWLGRTIDSEAKPIGFGDDRHVLIVGGTRGGKGTTFLINNLCHWPGSAIVVDPKGENATVTAVRRGNGNQFCDGMGQSVHVLDPYGVADVPDEYRSKFNPLDWLDGDDPLCTKKAERLATSLVPLKDKAEEYWDNEARGLIGTLLVHVATSFLYEGRRNLLTVRDLIMRGHVLSPEEIEMLDGEKPAEPMPLLWETMIGNTACDGYVRDSGTYFGDVAKNAKEQWSGIRGGVKTATDFLTSKGMRDILQSSDFNIADVKTDANGRTIYLSIPQDFLATDCGWLRMMIDMASTEAKLIAGKPATGHPTMLMLDEFAGLRRMDVLEKSIAQIAGYGVKMVCVVQELGQLEDVYGKNWETFVSGSGVRIFFSNSDARTKDYVSKMAGDTEIGRVLKTHTDTQGESSSTTSGTTKTKGGGGNKGSHKGLGGNYGTQSGTNYDPKSGGLMGMFPSKTGTNSGGGMGVNANMGWQKGTSTNWSEAQNESETYGQNRSVAEGQNESLYKRRLIEPHDVELKLARVESKNDPRYPGIALVMVAGYPPMPIRKCNYFEDPLFHKCFSPHPDHVFYPLRDPRPFGLIGEVPAPKTVLSIAAPNSDAMRIAFKPKRKEPVYAKLVVKPGMQVKAGQTLARGEPKLRDKENPPPPIQSPSDGIIYDTVAAEDGLFEVNPDESMIVLEPTKKGRATWEEQDQSSAAWKTVFSSTRNKQLLELAGFLGLVGLVIYWLVIQIIPGEAFLVPLIGLGLLRPRFRELWASLRGKKAEGLVSENIVDDPGARPSYLEAAKRELIAQKQEAWRYCRDQEKWVRA